MEQVHAYKKLTVYQKAEELTLSVYMLLRKYPIEERYALCDQIRRAVVSIPSNIAEGMSRYSNKEKIHFLEIAYGSLMEIECQLSISQKLNYISNIELKQLQNQIYEISRMLSGLRSSLQDDSATNSNL